jgi:hypothetical protein
MTVILVNDINFIDAPTKLNVYKTSIGVVNKMQCLRCL